MLAAVITAAAFLAVKGLPPAPDMSNVGSCQPGLAAVVERRRLDFPDMDGPLSARLKVRLEAESWESLVAGAKPDFIIKTQTPWRDENSDGRDFMWIEEGSDGRLAFRLEEAYTWRPKGQRSRWVLVDPVMPPEGKDWDALWDQAWSSFSGNMLPLKAVVGKEAQWPGYAKVNSTDPRGGTVYEIGWVSSVCDGSGGIQTLRNLFVWQDAGGRWYFLGEGPEGGSGKCGSCNYSDVEVRSTVHWSAGGAAPSRIDFVEATLRSEGFADGAVGLPEVTLCRDAVMTIRPDSLPAAWAWTGNRQYEYLVATSGDTLDQAAVRLSAWTGDWKISADETMRAKARNLVWGACRYGVWRLNPDLMERRLAAGTRILLPSEEEVMAIAKRMANNEPEKE
jgi:hypothetical protein